MEELTDRKIQALDFLNKTTIIYGGTGSGKSTIIKDIAYNLRRYIPTAIIFCESDQSNHSYSRAFAPKQFIHETIEETALEQFYTQQKHATEIYKTHCTKDVMMNVISAMRPDIRDEVWREIQKLMSNKDALAAKLKQDDGDAKNALELKFDIVLRNQLEYHINKNKHYINMKILGELETNYINRYIGFNPHKLVIIDDCTSQMERLKNNKNAKRAICEIFFQGRHCHITLLFATHSPISILPDIRSNAHVNIFTSAKLLQGWIQKMGLTKDERLSLERWSNIHMKDRICLINFATFEKTQWYKTKATLREDYAFCAPEIIEYARRIERDIEDKLASLKNNTIYRQLSRLS